MSWAMPAPSPFVDEKFHYNRPIIFNFASLSSVLNGCIRGEVPSKPKTEFLRQGLRQHELIVVSLLDCHLKHITQLRITDLEPRKLVLIEAPASSSKSIIRMTRFFNPFT
jgi:hypothetical protein